MMTIWQFGGWHANHCFYTYNSASYPSLLRIYLSFSGSNWTTLEYARSQRPLPQHRITNFLARHWRSDSSPDWQHHNGPADFHSSDPVRRELSPTSIKHIRVSLHQRRLTRIAQRRSSLKWQGKLAALPYADHSVSHSVITNYSISEDISILSSNKMQPINMVPVNTKPILHIPPKSTGEWNSCTRSEWMSLVQRVVCGRAWPIGWPCCKRSRKNKSRTWL